MGQPNWEVDHSQLRPCCAQQQIETFLVKEVVLAIMSVFTNVNVGRSLTVLWGESADLCVPGRLEIPKVP